MIKISNYEKIRRMSIDNLTEFLYFLNAHCLKECFLDELEENRGNINEIVPQCNIFCGMI